MELLPWITPEQAKLIRTRAVLWANYLNASVEGVRVPDEPCVTCTIVQCCGTPQTVNTIYDLTTQLRKTWVELAQNYDREHKDFPLRAVDWTLVLALFVSGELQRIPQEVLPKDCPDKAEYFCRYVRLVNVQIAQEAAKKE